MARLRRDRGQGGGDRDGERGVSAVEFAVLTPSLIILIFLVIQAGLYYHAVNVTNAVAQTTARVVRTYPGAPGQQPVTAVPSGPQLRSQAERVAVETWQALDANKTAERPVVRDIQVDAGFGPDAYNQLTLVVTSHSVNLLPGILPNLQIVAKASGPIEIFKPQETN